MAHLFTFELFDKILILLSNLLLAAHTVFMASLSELTSGPVG
jgi:hypothetical protein